MTNSKTIRPAKPAIALHGFDDMNRALHGSCAYAVSNSGDEKQQRNRDNKIFHRIGESAINDPVLRISQSCSGGSVN